MCNPDYLRFSSAVLIPSTVPESSLFISLLFIFIFFWTPRGFFTLCVLTLVTSRGRSRLWTTLPPGETAELQKALPAKPVTCKSFTWNKGGRVWKEWEKKGFIAGWLEHTGRNVERTEQSREGSLEAQRGDLRQNLWCSLCWPWTCCAAGLQLSLLHIPGAGFPGVSTTPLPE